MSLSRLVESTGGQCVLSAINTRMNALSNKCLILLLPANFSLSTALAFYSSSAEKSWTVSPPTWSGPRTRRRSSSANGREVFEPNLLCSTQDDRKKAKMNWCVNIFALRSTFLALAPAWHSAPVFVWRLRHSESPEDVDVAGAEGSPGVEQVVDEEHLSRMQLLF